jgi:hypothetical protein
MKELLDRFHSFYFQIKMIPRLAMTGPEREIGSCKTESGLERRPRRVRKIVENGAITGAEITAG